MISLSLGFWQKNRPLPNRIRIVLLGSFFLGISALAQETGRLPFLPKELRDQEYRDLRFQALKTRTLGPLVKNPLALLSNERGLHRGTVLVFLSVFCPCSKSYEKTLNQLAERFEAQGFSFFGIHSNLQEPLGLVQEHFQHLHFPLLQDLPKSPEGLATSAPSAQRGQLAEALRALKTPHAYLLNPQGQVLFMGGVGSSRICPATPTEGYLEKALQKVSQGLPLASHESYVRVLGCLIP